MSKKDKIMSDGWHNYNQNNYHCEECGSSDVEFLWDNGEIVGFHCNNCGDGGLDK